MFNRIFNLVEGTLIGVLVSYSGLVTAVAYVEGKKSFDLEKENKELRSALEALSTEGSYDHN